MKNDGVNGVQPTVKPAAARPGASVQGVNPVVEFRNNPTPLNAVRLALADHLAVPSVVDWEFVACMRDAVELLTQSAR